jgi:hypothetical protein
MMPRGATGLLYRPEELTLDRHGDPISDGQVVRATSPETYVGILEGILLGGPAATQSLQRRGESADTTGKWGIPLENGPVNNTSVKQDDYIVVGKVTYKVMSRPDWGHQNVITGSRPTYCWVQVAATTDL